MATIKAIEGRSVHQIQSGQVIVDLTSVVKELVENSLDAGATSVDVRFRTQGLDAVEIQDNGCGISKADYDTLCLKHYTSKLSNYDDLAELDTFGFRGEALSSLCALSDLHIVTAQDGEAPKGTRLDFEHSGKLRSTSVAATQKGSLVVVENLFQNLPVRRRELEKNIKREYSKVVNTLNAYACVSTKVRFNVSQQATKGKRTIVFSTRNNLTTKENIANVYGAKTILALVALDLDLEMQPTAPSQVLKDVNNEDNVSSRKIRVEGHVSKPIHGQGRQTPDRQMFFVNCRPCGLPQVAKAFNEVYKSYNMNQSPFVFANFKMDTNAYDVNVSPDKRTIMLHDQPRLLETLKEALIDLFEGQAQTVPTQQPQASKLPSFQPLSIVREPSLSSSMSEHQSLSQIMPQTQYSKSSVANEQPELDRLHNKPQMSSSSALLSSSLVEPGSNAADLILKFAGRNAEGREREHRAVQMGGPSKDKQKLARKLEREAARSSSSPRGGSTDSNVSTSRQPSESPPDDSVDATSRQLEGHSVARKVSIAQDTPTKAVAAQESTPKTPVLQGTMTLGPTKSKVASGPSVGRRGVTASHHDKKYGPQSQSTQFLSSLLAFAAPGAQVVDPSNKYGNQRTPRSARDAANAKRNTDVDAGSEQEEKQNSEASEANDESITSDEDRNDGRAQEIGQDFADERKHKAEEEARVQRMVQEAEGVASKPLGQKHATRLLKRSKETMHNLVQSHRSTLRDVEAQHQSWQRALKSKNLEIGEAEDDRSDIPSEVSPEERLSLTISKSDFANMRIVGQFNLGFIVAVRSSTHGEKRRTAPDSDELFIIDQHASDEIYNFHRLSATTTLTPQPLVRPHSLQLTAIEEEIVLDHKDVSLAKNGFNVTVDTTGEKPVGERCSLLTLPTSKETVFTTRDLEELLVLLSDTPAPHHHSPLLPDVDTSEHLEGVSSHRSLSLGSTTAILRPTKVRKMLAMRACRSSIMVGKALTQTGMSRVVRHMGEIERPWNCPHGRPTMRHLSALDRVGGWNEWGATWLAEGTDQNAERYDDVGDGVWLPSSSQLGEGRVIKDEDSLWRNYVATQRTADGEEDDEGSE